MENQSPILPEKLFPAEIRTIAVVAPAGPPPVDRLNAGIAALEAMGRRVVATPTLFARGESSYLAESLEARLEDFNRAIRDPEVDLILCARGGFGSVHLLPGIDWETLTRRKLPVMGYSDITAIHGAMLARRAGVAIAGPSAVKMPDVLECGVTARSMQAAWAATSGERLLEQSLSVIAGDGNEVEGYPFAANLAVLSTLCGTAFQPDLCGRILILEDVNEPLYKIDRYLTQLKMSGMLDAPAALCFGSFTGVPPTVELMRLEETLARELGVPVYRNFPFGHAFPMAAVNAAQKWRLAEGVVTVA